MLRLAFVQKAINTTCGLVIVDVSVIPAKINILSIQKHIEIVLLQQNQ